MEKIRSNIDRKLAGNCESADVIWSLVRRAVLLRAERFCFESSQFSAQIV
jgi:hypothetical protein